MNRRFFVSYIYTKFNGMVNGTGNTVGEITDMNTKFPRSEDIQGWQHSIKSADKELDFVLITFFTEISK